jgi:hypothetical protein
MVETFVVVVGSDCKEFTVYRHVATHRSPVFEAALNRDWQEAREGRVLLPDCEPDTFEGYLQHLCTHEISFSGGLSAQPCELVKMWILGDYLNDSAFCRAILHALFDHEKMTGPDAIEHLYAHTSKNSILRANVFHTWARRCHLSAVNSILSSNPAYPTEFIIDLYAHFQQSGKIVDQWVPPQPPSQPASGLPALGPSQVKPLGQS